MGKIATRSYCNQLKSNLFQTDLNRGVSLSECMGVRLNVGGSYQTQQLVQEGDISAGHILAIIGVGANQELKFQKLREDDLSLIEEKITDFRYFISDVCYAEGKIVIPSGDTSGDSFVIVSEDGGFTWNKYDSRKNEDMRGIAFGTGGFLPGGKCFVIVGTSDKVGGLNVKYSEDAYTWTRVAAPSNFLRNVVSFKGAFFAVGSEVEGKAGIFRSLNVKNWLAVAGSSSFEEIASSSSKVIAGKSFSIDKFNIGVSSSTTGSFNYSLFRGIRDGVYALKVFKEKFILGTDDCLLFASEDAVNWTELSLPFKVNLGYKLYTCGSVFIVVNTESEVYFTKDLVVWETKSFHVDKYTAIKCFIYIG